MRGTERSTDASGAEPGHIELGNLEVDPQSYRVRVQGESVHLTRMEFDLLLELVRNADRVLSLESLSQFLWGTSGRRERRRLSVMVFRLREKLQRSTPYQIHTIRRRGYGLLVSKRDPP